MHAYVSVSVCVYLLSDHTCLMIDVVRVWVWKNWFTHADRWMMCMYLSQSDGNDE